MGKIELLSDKILDNCLIHYVEIVLNEQVIVYPHAIDDLQKAIRTYGKIIELINKGYKYISCPVGNFYGYEFNEMFFHFDSVEDMDLAIDKIEKETGHVFHKFHINGNTAFDASYNETHQII